MNIVPKEDYWSIILNDPTQNGLITTEDDVFNRRINDVNVVLTNTLINSSDENLISKWETSLYIDEAEGKTITERKAEILFTLCEKNYAPVSIIKRFLLNLIGDESRFVIEFRRDEMKLIVRTNLLTDDELQTIDELLDKVVPQNIEVVHVKPAGYKRVEYLERNGSKIQYLLLPINNKAGRDTLRVESEHWFPVSMPTLQGEGIAIDKGALIFMYYDKGFYLAFDGLTNHSTQPNNTGADESIYFSVPQGVWFKYAYYRGLDEVTAHIDGTKVGSYIPEWSSNNTVSTVFSCFGRKSQQNGTYSTCGMYGRKKSFKLYENEKLKYNLVPCIDEETGSPCMYDLVSGEPFYNQGESDFLYPTESTTYSLRRVLPDWGQLTERGLRRLYHAPADYEGELQDYALENGFKPIVEPEMPDDGYWRPEWRETETQLILEWIEIETPPTENFNLEQPTEI